MPIAANDISNPFAEYTTDDLQQLSAALSHELRDPVREALALLPANHAAATQHLELVLRRMAALKTYLYLCENTENPLPVKLSTIVVQARRKLDDDFRDCGARLDMDELPELPSARPNQLLELFCELFQNALDYRGSATPVLRLTSVIRGRTLTLTLADNGSGMEEEYCPYVLGLFRRGENAESQPELADRLGMGLCTALKVAQNHGGGLYLESSPGAGVRVIISLAL